MSTTDTSTLRAALYGRVSLDKQSGQSVAQQQAESEAACKANGWTLAGIYEDNDVSASRFTTKQRPGWANLEADLDAGKFDVLVLWEPSRGSRELVVWATLLAACRRHKILVHVTSHHYTYDMANSRDWKTLAEEGVSSAYASEETSKRVLRSMAAGAVAGRPHGRTPYGYVRRYDPATKELIAQEADPQTAPVVRDIFRRLAAAEPVSVVTKGLNDRGVLPPMAKKWNRQNVRKLALNHTYIGQRDYRGEVRKGNWPALVPEEDWYAARQILTAPGRTTTKPRPGLYKYLLSYIARCGTCDEPLTAMQRTIKPAYYFCPNSHVSCGVIWLDSAIEPLILARLNNPELMARLSGGDDDKAVVEARTEAAALKERLDGFRDAAAAGELTPASLAHVEARLLTDIKAAEKKAASAATPSVLRGLTGTDDIAARWEQLSIAGRRRVVARLMGIKLDRATLRGPAAVGDYDRIKVTWLA
jgi:site-specific DNA recombinase